VPGAVLIPLPELAARQEEIPDGDPLYVICAAGGRSLTAAKALVDAGYHAVSVAGGTNGWIERGGVVVTGAERG
jgi:rhodanese-related sulfurtransferase